MARSDTRGLNQREQDALRQRGIAMVRAGATQIAVARELGVRPATVCTWMKSATRTASRRRGPRTSPHRKLKAWQDKRIALHLANREPMELRLPHAVWTRQAVAELIERLYGVALSRWAVTQHLRRWGFVPRTAVPCARQPKPADVERWLATTLPDLQRQAKRDHAAIWFQHEAGKAPDELEHVLFASTSRGAYAFSVRAGALTPAIFLRFAQQLCEYTRRKVYLVLDGHPIHRSRSLAYWAAANPHRIRLIVRPDPGHQPPAIIQPTMMDAASPRRL